MSGQVGTGFESTDGASAAADAGTFTIPPNAMAAVSASAPPALARKKVDMIEDGDVGCSGKSKKKTKKVAQARPAVQQPAQDMQGAERGARKSGREKYGQVTPLPLVWVVAGLRMWWPTQLDIRYPEVSWPANGECGLCAPPGCCYKRQIGRLYVCCERTSRCAPRAELAGAASARAHRDWLR
jgi:hypothetical protein